MNPEQVVEQALEGQGLLGARISLYAYLAIAGLREAGYVTDKLNRGELVQKAEQAIATVIPSIDGLLGNPDIYDKRTVERRLAEAVIDAIFPQRAIRSQGNPAVGTWGTSQNLYVAPKGAKRNIDELD